MDARWGGRMWRPARAIARRGRAIKTQRQLMEKCNDLQSQLAETRAQIEQYEMQLDENRKQYHDLESMARRMQSDLRSAYSDAKRNKEILEDRANQAAERARIDVAKRIMVVADEFSTAIELAETQDMDPKWFDGFKAMSDKIDKGLNDAGYRRFESLGEQMDPTRHEALATMPTSDAMVGKVIQVIEAGYEDTETSEVVRVAKVLVGRANDEAATE